ncbi:hypothetical protein ACHAXA_011359 [Cyclostephanos tholiformis]|uniref:DUF6824 domain-containing protein n=1 Tax=Cyclostephanos tholiformis TaxID=382380 RepID=A0ABD3R3L3_9STRA
MEGIDGDESPSVKSSEGVVGDDAAAGDNDRGIGDNKSSALDTDDSSAAVVLSSTEGIKFYTRDDVLCGRGGGTNVHPGNRRFRDLVNANRLAYLGARKNNKPDISRSIVRTIRESNGRFLRRDGKRGYLWFEIGDDGAREKTSQALRQRAPEMKKMLFSDEDPPRQWQKQHRAQQDSMKLRQDELMMGMGMGSQGTVHMGGQGMGGSGFPQMNMVGGGGVEAPPPSMVGGNQINGQGGDPGLSQQAFFAMMFNNQTYLISPEQIMILQQLAMSGMNPHGMNVQSQKSESQNSPSQNSQTQNGINDITSQTICSSNNWL